jgi:hypothetical protein
MTTKSMKSLVLVSGALSPTPTYPNGPAEVPWTQPISKPRSPYRRLAFLRRSLVPNSGDADEARGWGETSISGLVYCEAALTRFREDPCDPFLVSHSS